jgi:hypothetical protein
MRILSIYENGSGQKLNLQKTSNFFFFFFFFFFLRLEYKYGEEARNIEALRVI